MKNHAFIIQVHTHAELLGEILSILEAPNHYFFIHIDKKIVDITPFEYVAEKHTNTFLISKRKNVNWGGTNQFKVTIDLLQEVISMKNVHFDYCHSISGQDFPTCNNKIFDATFENCTKSYMFYDKIVYTEKYNRRVNNYYLDDYLNQRGKFAFIKHKAEGVINRITPQRKEIADLHGGWSWFSWHRKVIEYVLSYINKNPEYLKRFNFTTCADELFFHTLLFPKLKELDIVPDNALRFVEWHPKRPSASLPLILEETEYDAIINSKALFCRKIDPVISKKLILRIKESIQNKDFNQ